MSGRPFGKFEVPTVLAALAVLFFTLGFVTLAVLVKDGVPLSFDPQILLDFRDAGDLRTPLGPHFLIGAVSDFTAFGSTTVLAVVTASAVGFLLALRRVRAALFLAFTIVAGQALCSLLKLVVARSRPEVVPHLADVWTQSFPSSHAMMSAVVYLTLAALAARYLRARGAKILLVVLAVVMTLLVGLSRLYLGVHYPSDVLAGWCAGLAWALLCWVWARAARI